MTATEKARQLVARRREEILAEATALFAREGYARAKVDDVALTLGLGKGTIYRYFPTKEKLFLAAADRAMEDLQRSILGAVEQFDDPFARIRAAVRTYLEFFDRNLSLVEIFIHERAEFRDRKRPTYLAYRDKNLRNLEVVLGRLKAQGLVRDVDERVAAAIMGDLLYGTVITHLLRGGRRSLAALAPQIVDLIFHGLLTPAGSALARASGAPARRPARAAARERAASARRARRT